MNKPIEKKDYSSICKAQGANCDGGIDCKTRCTPRASMCKKCWCSHCVKGKC
jgi:hypothetical protein